MQKKVKLFSRYRKTSPTYMIGKKKIIQKTPLFKKNAHVTYEIKKYHIESA